MKLREVQRRTAGEARALKHCIDAGLVRADRPKVLVHGLSGVKRFGVSGRAIVLAVARFPDQLAVINELGSLTYAEMDRRSNALANAWRERGLRAGDGTASHLARLHALAALLLTALFAGLLATAAPAPATIAARPAPGARCAHGSWWVASWTAAPSDAGIARGLGSRPLQAQTVRMVVRPTLGGRTVRIRLSNAHGPSAATLGHATIALRRDGASAVAGSLRELTFGRRASVTIKAGASVVSDPVRLRVRPGQYLLVSLHVPGVILRPSQHFITNQTSYLSVTGAGDHADDVGAASFPMTTKHLGFSNGWYFISGVDVRGPRRSTRAVVAFGDSITDGAQGLVPGTPLDNPAALDRNARYPNFLATRLTAYSRKHRRNDRLSVVNEGIAGNQLLVDSPGEYPYGASALARFRRDVLQVPGVRDVIILEGINDLGENPGLPPARLVAALRRLTRMAQASGVRVHLGTLTPALGAANGHGTAATNRRRTLVNRWIRGQHLAGVIDFEAAVRDPQAPARLDSRYDSGDHLHPNEAGYRAMAAAVPVRHLVRPRARRGC